MKITKILVTVIIWLSYSTSANATPILYDLYGQISHNSGTYETFRGSFVLSDPIVEYLGPPDYDSRGWYRTDFEITSFRLESNSYSLNQTGSSGVAIFWDEDPLSINPIDSELYLHTSGGYNYWQIAYWGDRHIEWHGDFNEHPTSIIIPLLLFPEPTGSYFSSGYRIQNFTAAASHSVPEPATVLLLGIGFVSMAMHTRKKRGNNTRRSE